MITIRHSNKKASESLRNFRCAYSSICCSTRFFPSNSKSNAFFYTYMYQRDTFKYFSLFYGNCIIFCMFVVREYLKLNQDATNIEKKSETKKKGRHTVASTEDLSRHRFECSRSDLPPLFNFNLFIMREQKGQSTKRAKNATIQLPVSNQHGIPVFSDFLNELQRQFDIEKNIKNNLYAFIIKHGLFNELLEYSAKHDMSSPDGHQRAVTSIAFNVLPEFNN